MSKDFNTLSKIVAQLEIGDYECTEGLLKNNLAFISLKQMANFEEFINITIPISKGKFTFIKTRLHEDDLCGATELKSNKFKHIKNTDK